ncbi:DUF4998 domain-containing protein [Pedobacter metabolipauper]|uniref:Uncharacterized protein DUF5000 n=1 Tax=Pedobacter metabolipauper TaxID=425513 RepID=A0A4V3D0T2_9SPHI|nr:DUF4998 domain-containing protein [Pedobacter metabolipauper]TDQ07339.1 uncharacterized protein DUF5000 [Pedobacter metabolipauper]
MKFNIYLIGACAAMLLLINSCSKDATEYQDYLNGKEKIYPGLPKGITASAGNYRVKLSWTPSPDPTVKKYRIFWNNGADSLEVAAGTNVNTPVSVIISRLVEYNYSFTVYSYDESGNRSIPVNINNIKIYGDSYKSSLTNRFLDVSNPYELDGNDIKLNFLAPDTINTGTLVKYTHADGTVKSVTLDPDQTEITLSNYKSGTKIYYQSAYVPVRAAIDTFYTHGFDSLTNIMVPLDKRLFAEIKLANDVGTYGSNTGVKNLWNGNTSPTGYPDIFHSDANTALPHHFTFDLGKVYSNMAQFEIIGRDCCNNPTKFEIWGIADLTGAVTGSPSNSPGWTAESLGRGWKLLKEVSRSDDGSAPFKVAFADGLPPVRYIRIRVLEVASGDSHYSNISEVTFWNK